MILVDTSVWVDRLRADDARLSKLLEAGDVLAHPFVIGELALGRLKERQLILSALADPPQARAATDREVLHFMKQNALSGTGIGYVDAHLLAAARITPGTGLWTRDRRLREAATRLNLAV